MRVLRTLIPLMLLATVSCAIRVQPGERFISRGEAFVVLQEDHELVLIRDRVSHGAGGIEGYVDEIARVDCHAVEHGQIYAIPNVPDRAFRFDCDGTVTYFISASAAANALPLPVSKPHNGNQPRPAVK